MKKSASKQFNRFYSNSTVQTYTIILSWIEEWCFLFIWPPSCEMRVGRRMETERPETEGYSVGEVENRAHLCSHFLSIQACIVWNIDESAHCVSVYEYRWSQRGAFFIVAKSRTAGITACWYELLRFTKHAHIDS